MTTDETAGRRSDRTKAAILAAARDRFATDGYERATIRAIAADARIDPSMVMRYFGSKERLFAAAADFDLQLPDLARVGEAAGAVLVEHFLDRWEGDDALQALLRAAVNHEAAAERMREIFTAQLGPAIRAVCRPPAEAQKRAGLVSSQILGMALCRYVLRLPPVARLDRREIVNWLGPTVQRYLAGAADAPTARRSARGTGRR